MSGDYKADCGCVIHFIQWTSKRKVATQKSCPLHKNAKELLDICNKIRSAAMNLNHLCNVPSDLYDPLVAAINKAEGKLNTREA